MIRFFDKQTTKVIDLINLHIHRHIKYRPKELKSKCRDFKYILRSIINRLYIKVNVK